MEIKLDTSRFGKNVVVVAKVVFELKLKQYGQDGISGI